MVKLEQVRPVALLLSLLQLVVCTFDKQLATAHLGGRAKITVYKGQLTVLATKYITQGC